ncbi:MAG: DUF4153 domain-containing protein [Candidatus Gracilibacteria bacterium]|nr:DUF4153 domain-containing protein [Candidatus Gracilibacteria bacterium]
MKNIFSKFSIENFVLNVKSAFFRFPLSFVSSVLMFIILEYLVYNSDVLTQFSQNFILKSVLSLVTVYFLSVGIYLFAEKYSFNRLKTCLFQLFSVVFGVLFYFSFEQNLFNNFYSEELVYIIITFVGVISFVFVSSYLKSFYEKKFGNEEYYTFFNSISSKILMAFVVGISLMILGFIALSSLFALFELSKYLDESKYYGYWSVFALSLFAPVYFLTIAPEKDLNLLLLDKIKDNRFYNFLSNYIALPFIIIYFFILYAYSIKVLANFSDWPKGIISWMVIGFSLFGYLIYIFSYAFELKSELVKLFRKVFPFAVLFQTPMLFYAIYLRINQYDFTINRYLVVVFGIFLVLVSLYFIISRIRYLLFIPGLLTIFVIIISVGPWGVYSFPESRQLELLKPDLIQANILQGSQLVLLKDEKDIDAKLSGQIYDKVSYLCSFHGCDSMGGIFGDILIEIKNQDKVDWEKTHNEELKRLQDLITENTGVDEIKLKDSIDSLERAQKQVYPGIYSWTYQSKLIEKLKVKPYYEGELFNQKYITFSLDFNKRNGLVKVSGYDYLFPVGGIYSDTVLLEKGAVDDKNVSELYSAKFDVDNTKLIISKYGILFEEFDLSQDINNYYESNISNINSYGTVEMKDIFTLEKKGTKIDIKIMLDDFVVDNPDYKGGADYLGSVSGNILLKER